MPTSLSPPRGVGGYNFGCATKTGRDLRRYGSATLERRDSSGVLTVLAHAKPLYSMSSKDGVNAMEESVGLETYQGSEGAFRP